VPDTEEPRQIENEAGGGISRRQMLRRSLVAGGSAALLWSTPAVASVKLAQAPNGSPLTTVGGTTQRRNGNGNGDGVSVLGDGFSRGQGGGALPFTGLSLPELLAAGLGATAAGAGAASYDKVRKKHKARKIRKARAAAAAAAEKAIADEEPTPDE
jgi:hypothetical protein